MPKTKRFRAVNAKHIGQTQNKSAPKRMDSATDISNNTQFATSAHANNRILSQRFAVTSAPIVAHKPKIIAAATA